MIRATALTLALAFASSAGTPPALAPLADMQADLRALSVEMQALRSELVASGQPGFQAAGGDSAIDRMNAIEAAIARLTGETELLANRLNRIAQDGARRIGDIEFRLCEMDENCDLGALMSQPDLGRLGGNNASGAAVAPATPAASQDQGATTPTEQRAFDQARAALDRGQFQQAADGFAALARNHAGGPLTAQALYLQGLALDATGQQAAAASAWLESFAARPDGAHAADALLGLARLADAAGGEQAEVSCLYLAEITVRFARSAQAGAAAQRARQQGCDAPPDG